MRLYSFVAAAALATASLAAHADTITQNFVTGGFSTSSQQTNTISLLGFNPPAGTLNAVTVTFAGSYILSGVNSDLGSFADFFLALDGFGDLADTGLAIHTKDGTYAVSATATSNSGPGLMALTNSGDVSAQFSVEALGSGTLSNATPNGFNGSLTYDYTPAVTPVAATPEPSSLALLGTGLLGALGVVRKRFA